MRYFDVVSISGGVDPKLAARLGFSRILAFGSEIVISDRPHQGKRCIVSSRDEGMLMKSIKDQSVIGIAIPDNEIIGKVIAAAAGAEKPIVIDLQPLFAQQWRERPRSIARLRGLIKEAIRARAGFICISNAKNPNYLVSSNQMAEILKLIGLDDKKRKDAMAKLGEYFDN